KTLQPRALSEAPTRGASLYRAARWRTITELRPTPIFGAAQKDGMDGSRARRLGGSARRLRPFGEGAAARWKSLRAFHRLDRLRAGARCRGLGGQADAQVGEFLEQGQARAGGQAKDMAAAAAVGADEVEVPARHVDGSRGRRETEADQGTVDVVEGMH